jgi:uncharacterized SAM-binding protein YcdF (DUF218 family)
VGQTGRVTTTPATAAAAVSTAPGRRPRRWLRWSARVVALVLALATLWVGSVSFRIWWTARQDSRPASDAIVVLGASQFNGVPSPALQARLEHARTLYEQGVAPLIVTTGYKQPGDVYTEASAGRTYLIEHGVPASAVLALPVGADTLQSLRAVESELASRHLDSVVIVTDPWHSFRSAVMARDLGLQVATSPTRSGPVVSTRAIELRYIVRETGAYLYYRLTGSSPDSGVTTF